MRNKVLAEVTAGRGESVAHIGHRIQNPGVVIPEGEFTVDASLTLRDRTFDFNVQEAIHELVAQGIIYASGHGYKLASDIV